MQRGLRIVTGHSCAICMLSTTFNGTQNSWNMMSVIRRRPFMCNESFRYHRWIPLLSFDGIWNPLPCISLIIHAISWLHKQYIHMSTWHTRFGWRKLVKLLLRWNHVNQVAGIKEAPRRKAGTYIKLPAWLNKSHLDGKFETVLRIPT